MNTQILVSLMEKRAKEVGVTPQLEVFMHRVIADVIESTLAPVAPVKLKASKPVKGPSKPRVFNKEFTCSVCGTKRQASNNSQIRCSREQNPYCINYIQARDSYARYKNVSKESYISYQEYLSKLHPNAAVAPSTVSSNAL